MFHERKGGGEETILVLDYKTQRQRRTGNLIIRLYASNQ